MTDLLTGSPARGIFSCVVDTDPRFHLDVLRWYATLDRIVGVRPEDLVVHAVERTESDVLDYLRAKGVAVLRVPRFDDRSPHCNKISGALTLAERGVDGIAVLTDTDLVVLEDPRGLDIEPAAIGLRGVVGRNPPVDVLERVFAAAGVGPVTLMPLEMVPGDSTVAGHGNGGFYLVPGAALARLAQTWAHWASWLLGHIELLDPWWHKFVDQTAMTLALTEEGIRPYMLGLEWNFPSQNPRRLRADAPTPKAIHYHAALTRGGLLKPTGISAVDEQVALANRAIEQVWHESFPNASFWDWRYLTDPERGSGGGSRGEPLEHKRKLVGSVVAILQPVSVLDVGCGDGEATRGLDLGRYTGIDVSAQAVKRARKGRPDGVYHVGSLSDREYEAELTICLDVLIHEANETEYRDLVSQLLRSSTRALLVSGYEAPPDGRSPIVHYHEPLSASLSRLGSGRESLPLRKVHGITTYLVLSSPTREERLTLAGLVDDRDQVGGSRTSRGE
jgi:hypothetical protein